jgi:hypothetical protein
MRFPAVKRLGGSLTGEGWAVSAGDEKETRRRQAHLGLTVGVMGADGASSKG